MPLTATTGEPLLITGVTGTAGTDMTFRQLRQLMQHFSKGVAGITELKVTQRAAGANMSVDVSAGTAIVIGTGVTGPEGQHKYQVPLSGAVNLDTVVAPISSTRTDQVVVTVYDVGDDPANAGGLAEGRVRYVQNTTEGTGVAVLPANSYRLATVAVTVGATSITTAMITDTRNMYGPEIPGEDGVRRRLGFDASGVFGWEAV